MEKLPFLKRKTKIPNNGVLRGKISWESPANIALIKYWGKYGRQLPHNPSLSFSLKKSVTVTKLSYIKKGGGRGISFTYYFNGKKNLHFAGNIRKYFESIKQIMPFLTQINLEIESKNTFPHSAGIASSASFYSSLALGLCSIERKIDASIKKNGDFYKKASYLARLGSGSASRSVYGNFSIWGKFDNIKKSSDYYAIPISSGISKEYLNYHDAILIVSSKQKEISSRSGHDLMDDNPYAKARFRDAKDNLKKLLSAMRNINNREFTDIVERDALSIHAMMMVSKPGYTLLKPNTLELIEKIRQYRQKNNIDICFTLDAGPNVHLLYSGKHEKEVKAFIRKELLKYCEKGRWIDDRMGSGPRQIE